MTTQIDQDRRQGYPRLRPYLSVIGLLLCLAALPSTATAKTYEQVDTFGGALKPGETSEEFELGRVSALAVNSTGAGGVAKGTVYAVLAIGEKQVRIARFEPTIGGLKFVERWDVIDLAEEKERVKNSQPPYSICGPAVVSESLIGSASCSLGPDGGPGSIGVAVDQTTGNVYASLNPNGNEVPQGEDILIEYPANGSEVLTRFGEKGPTSTGHVLETPEKIHGSVGSSTLAVNHAGEVFYFDYMAFDNFYHRLMVFRPTTPGDYTEYEYAGHSHDISAGFFGQSVFPTSPKVDEAGHVYVFGESGEVTEFDPAFPDKAICSFSFKDGGVQAATVDPSTDEVFLWTYKQRLRIHQLSACEGGAFHEIGEFALTNERENLSALVVDPNRQLSPGRQPGVLYGAAPGPGVKGGLSTSALGYIFAQPEERPPTLEGVAPANVAVTSGVLSAKIDPRGFATHYAFHFLTEAEYMAQGESFAEAAESPIGGADLAPVGGNRRVEAVISGLEPDTAYVFQVIASSNCSPAEPSKVCTVESAAYGLHTYAANLQGLPDGRAYEMVSPPEKHGGQVFSAEPARSSCFIQCKPGESSERFPLQSSPDGGSVVYEGEPFGQQGALIENEYFSRRTAGGWETTTLAPGLLQNRNEGNGYAAFDPGLTSGILRQSLPVLSGSTPGEYMNLYSQPTADPGSTAALLTGANAAPTCASGTGQGSLELTYAGASTDLSRVFFEANDILTPEATGACGETNLYEWAGGSLRVVNLLPAAAQSAPGATFGSGRWLKSGNPNNPSPVTTHAISDDGSRVFFTGADGNLYVRLDGSSTLEVPSPGNCKEATPLAERVCYLTASADGSRVLLSSGQAYSLDKGGIAYEPSVDLSGGQGGFLGIAGQSEDLSRIYFVDTTDLTGAEENHYGSTASAGERNVYSWSSGTTRFVAQLAIDYGDSGSGDFTAAPGRRTAQASPAGRWLAFQNVSPITGYDNRGLCQGSLETKTFKEKSCVEVFLYDAQSDSLVCASCNPSGSRPLGDASVPVSIGERSYLPPPRALTDNGRLFFDSGDQLAPGDTNGHVEDVYEFEPMGVGGCTRTDHCLNLISPGRGSADSNFLTMDGSGDNVFFTTRDQLVKADKDELFDLYDARVGGGFAETAPPTECKGEACQQAAPPSFPQAPPPSMGLTGEANTRSGCRKGRVKHGGRCVKKSKHRARKHHNKRSGRKGGNR